MQLDSRWENEYLILKGTAGDGNMGKGDKRGVTQRSDGGEFVLSILNVRKETRSVIHTK